MENILVTTSSFGMEDSQPSAQLKAAGYDIVTNPFKRKLTEEEVIQLLLKHNPVGMIAGVEPLTRFVLEKASNLKVISRCGIGMDSIDLRAAEDFGISVRNTPDAPTIPVAELTIGLILSLLRCVTLSDREIRDKQWIRPMGMLLHGKTVGIVGCGRIGSYVAKLTKAFGCNVLGFDTVVKESSLFDITTLDKLLADSDIVSLHLPYNENTHHFFNENRLRSMKKGAFIINAARGGLIDEQALMKLLREEHLSGAALDCFENEPYTGPLTELENVVLTGHIGSYAREGRSLMERQAVENLLHELSNGSIAREGE